MSNSEVLSVECCGHKTWRVAMPRGRLMDASASMSKIGSAEVVYAVSVGLLIINFNCGVVS